MNAERTFPQDLNDFLRWVKETTEAYWRNLPQDEALYDAKWLPLTDQQIYELEQRYNIRFGVEHRAFLRVLHTLDKPYPHIDYGQMSDEEKEYYENEEREFYANESEEQKKKREFWTPPYEPSYFYNWITEKEWIESRLAWIDFYFTGDILGVNRSWLRSWGPRPESDEEKVRIFREWYRNAPQLLPLRAHTFLMDDGGHGLRPVMSVRGFDTIIMAWSLRHYLIREFDMALGLAEWIHEEPTEDYPKRVSYTDLVKGIPEIDAWQTITLNDADIPHWREVLHYYNNPPERECWQGFWVPYAKPVK
jgi:hypothetical protein